MTWTGKVFTVGAVLTAAQMNNLQADITAIMDQDSGAPAPTTDFISLASQIANGIIGQLEIGASAVGQGELKTSTGSVSRSTTGNSTLPGGAYGFYPQIKYSGGGGANGFTLGGSVTTSYVTNINLFIDAGTSEAQQRYISASPPWHSYRQNDPVPIFTFALLDKTTLAMLGTYVAVDPPHGNNGPTIINPLGRLQKLAHARLPGMWDAIKDIAAQRALHNKAVDDLFAYMNDPDNALTIRAEMARKFTQAEKNADMALIPHPFPDFDPTTQVVIVINPTDDRMGDNLFCRHTYLGDSIAEMLHGGYLTLDNTPMPGLITPPSVMAVIAKLKLT